MKHLKYILFLSIIVVFACDCMEEVVVFMSRYLKLLKYGTSLVAFSICGIVFFVEFVRKTKTGYLFFDEFRRQCIVIAYFGVVSLYEISRQKRYTYKTMEEILQLLLPFLYTFFVINILKFKDILTFMKLSLVISFGSYFITNIELFLDFWKNLLMISVANSFSPFEANSFSEIASGLSAFFVYYRKKCPIWSIVSIAFVLLTFKRVFMLQVFLLIIVCLLHLQDKYIPIWFIRLSIVIGVTGTLVFNFLLQRQNAMIFENIFGKSVGDFTMGRVYRIWYRLSTFESFGFGSTSEVLGYNLELDLIKILMEVGLIGLILFIWCYFSLGKANLYTYMLMGASLLNLLFASGLTSSVGWIMRIIALGTITYVMPNNKNFNINVKKSKKIRFVVGHIRLR